MSEGLSALGALKAAREEIAEQERNRNKPKAGWWTPPASGEAVKIQFLNELDPDAQRYNPDYGLFLQSVEHQAPGPKGFMSRALDTIKRDGRDWAQEQHIKDPKAGWKPRKFFYINVAVEEDGVIVPKIVQRNLSNQFVADLIEEYEDGGFVGITGQTYAIKRVGEGTSTQWRIKAVSDEMDVSGVQPWDLNEHAVKYVPYEKQEEFYMRNAVLPQGSSVTTSSAGNSTGRSVAPNGQPQEPKSEEDWGW